MRKKLNNKYNTNKELRRGRIAACLVYFTLGSMSAAWIARLPDIQRQMHISSSTLGTILLVSAIVGLAAMQLAPLLVRKYGHRTSLGVLSVVYPLSFLGIAFADSIYLLVAAVILTSGLGSLVGMLANTHAADVERAYERSIMSSFHALYSVGALVGAGVAGLLAGNGLSAHTSILTAVIFHFALIVIFIRWLLRVAHSSPKKFDASVDHLSHKKHRAAWWRGVLLLGSLAFVAYLAESTVATWSTIFMREYRDANAGVAVMAFMAFSACMAVGRLSGDRIANRFGKVTVVQMGALLGFVGLCIGLMIPSITATIIGFSLVGLGLSVLVPLLFSIAGNLAGGESHAAIARVGTIAYAAVLIGPVIIGGVAQGANMVVALFIPAILLLYITFAAGYTPQVERKNRARRTIRAARKWLVHALDH